jgi:hypothetical protein
MVTKRISNDTKSRTNVGTVVILKGIKIRISEINEIMRKMLNMVSYFFTFKICSFEAMKTAYRNGSEDKVKILYQITDDSSIDELT